MINVNTHHAYLNTDIVFNSEKPFVTLKDELTGLEYTIADKPLVIKLCAGNHRLYSVDSGEEINIEIEDAIKLGGSKIKNAYIFDKNPWAFVVTKDRLYATNIETNEEKVEYNLSPDEIHSFGRRNGNYFLFKTKEDYSIFNIETGSNVISFTNYIYSNFHFVIYKSENSNVIVYNFISRKNVVEFEGQYSLGSKFYFVKDGKLHGLNLKTGFINIIDSVGCIGKESILVDNTLLKLDNNNRFAKIYHLYSLGDGETNISKTEIITPHYIESYRGVKTNEYYDLLDNYKELLSNFDGKLSKYFESELFCSGIQVEAIKSYLEGEKRMICLSGQIVSYPKKNYDIPFVLKGEEEGKLLFRNVVVGECLIEEDMVEKEDRKTKIRLKTGESLLCCSESETLYITKIKGKITLHNCNTNNEQDIFVKTFDSSSYNRAYFTSDGKNVVFGDKGNNLGILGFEDMIKNSFEIEGSSVARLSGINGYKPDINMSGRIPVWRDPISLKRIPEIEMMSHVFMSSDGKYIAEMQMKKLYYNRLTDQNISIEDAKSLEDKYNWSEDASEEERIEKSKLRESLVEEYGRDIVFDNFIGSYKRSIWEKEYLKSKPKITPLFLKRLCYVIYQDIDKKEEKKILIGPDVWFLNYVSFSYDSRYLAFGAKMVDQGGVFEIYDLQKEEVICRNDNDNLLAVWMTMFSKTGDVAYYDSHANAMVVSAESEYTETHIAKGKSLLCFSPSGKYIALSDQNYISYLYHPGPNWGHQPSGNVFIYETKDLDNCLEQYNDLGDGIEGASIGTRKAGNVASAAFSSDEKRLLAVGDDGVVVIRNLKTTNNKENN